MKPIKRTFFFLMSFLGLCSCAGAPAASFRSLVESQPYAVQLLPAPYPPLPSLDRVEIVFSESIQKETASEESIFVLRGEIDADQPPEVDDLEADIRDGILKIVPGTFPYEEDSKKVSWKPEAPIDRGALTVVITPKLLGENNVPFNQKPGSSPTPLIAVFRLALSGESAPSPSTSSGNASKNLNPKNRPATLMIHEIFYDSTESDTNGSAFIELYGTPGADVDNYQVALINGSDGNILETVTLIEGSKIGDDGIFLIADAKTGAPDVSAVEAADLIDNFDPQNGPDGIQLLDDRGQLLDTVVYGEGSVETAQNGLPLGEGHPAPDVPAGHSLSRTQALDTNDNLADFTDRATPSPGVL